LFVAEHSVQAPASVPVFWQAGRAGSGQLGAPSAAHATQVCVVAEQTGVVPPQSALPRQLTQTPPPPEVSHSGTPAAHRLVSVCVQTAHAPEDRQTGNFGSQSALVRQARQVCRPVSQMGRVPAQSVLAAHSTQVLLASARLARGARHAGARGAADGGGAAALGVGGARAAVMGRSVADGHGASAVGGRDARDAEAVGRVAQGRGARAGGLVRRRARPARTR
jgi:hypothetical protein